MSRPSAWWLAALVILGLVATTGVALGATINVSVGSYYFEDATVGDGKITAKIGDQLRLSTVDRGTDGRPHTADVDELNIHSGGLTPGSTWVSPVITKPGTFTLYCKVHLRTQNHATTLVVTGAALTPTPAPSRASPTPAARGTVSPAAATAAPSALGSPTSDSSPVAGGSPGSPAPGTSGDAATTPDPGSSTTDGPLPPGLTGGTATDWLRSVRLGVFLLIPLAALALLAARRSRARLSAPGDGWPGRRPTSPRDQATRP